jgi:hypothetical protein
MIAIALSAYLLVGFFLVTLGPASKNISKEIDSARGTPLTNAIRERVPPSEKKLLLFRHNPVLNQFAKKTSMLRRKRE